MISGGRGYGLREEVWGRAGVGGGVGDIELYKADVIGLTIILLR